MKRSVVGSFSFKFLLPAFWLVIFCHAYSLAQCPADETDLANGGTFSGTCSIAVGGSIDITANVIWTSGTLSITGNNGDLNLSATLTINGGTVQLIDGNNGDVDVLSGGSIVVTSGATFTAYEEIQVQSGGSMTISGTVNSSNSYIDIDAGGVVTVNSTGTLASGGNQDIDVQGTLTNSGTVDSDDDLIVSGTFTNSGTAHADDDITFSGTVTNSGAIDNGDDMTISGTMINSGTVDTGDEITVNGSLTTSGTITPGGDLDIDAGDVTVSSGGFIDIGDDLQVFNGGTLTIDSGGSVSVTNDAFNNNDGGDNGPGEEGHLVVNGLLTVGGDLTIHDTTPNSSLSGTGTIDVSGTYTDDECPTTGDFCSCEGTGVGSCDSVLPIELLDFSANQADNRVELNWSTATELNNDFFTIERMYGLDDAEKFDAIKTIKGQGTTNERHDYQTFDYLPFEGKNYYRLKQTDFDGNFSYSDVKMVEFEGSKTVLKVFPNPVKEETLTIELNSLKPDQYVPLRMMNSIGVSVYQTGWTADQSGMIRATIQTNSFPKGIYIVVAGSEAGPKRKLIIE